MGRRVRLGALLLALALTLLGLTGAGGNLFSRAGAHARMRCDRPMPGEVASVSLAELDELRASLVPVVNSAGGRTRPGGTVTPIGIRSGDTPEPVIFSRSPAGTWPGGYQLRHVSAGGDEVVADVLQFRSAGEARAYAELVARSACRRPPLASPTSSPPEALNLVSLDFASFTRYEALVVRGPRVYRIAEVHAQHPLGGPSGAELRVGLAAVDALACRLPDAHCLGTIPGSAGAHLG